MSSLEAIVPAESEQPQPAWYVYRVGVLPLALFIPLFALVSGLTVTHTLTSGIASMIAALVVGGAACAWLGGLVPFLRRLGAPAIVAAFLPSYLVYRHWLPANFELMVQTFTQQTNFIYLYITAIIVGSIFGMNRTLLLRGMAKVCVPLLAGSLLALVLGSLAGMALGLPMATSIPMVLVPIMAGGVGEGAIPLSAGYAEIFHQDPAQVLSHLLPVVLFANFIAIILAGSLNTLGLRYPRLSGNGLLEKSSTLVALPDLCKNQIKQTPELYLSGLLFAIALYLASVLAHKWIPLPAPVTMLVLAVIFKIANLIPPSLEKAVAAVGSFFAMAVTYPLLFAVAVALTPWASVVESLHPANLILITLVVLVLTVTGFFVGKLLGLFPIEAALINACHTGSGGTGDVAILTAAERLELMPFAQVATRIGGAITVTLTILILRWLTHTR